MYDPKSEPHEFVAGDRTEAVAKACSFYSVAEGELNIAELAEADVSGLAARALIVAVPKDARRPVRSDSDDRGGRDRDRGRDRGDRGDRGGRGDRDRGRDRGGRGPDRDRGGRGRDRDRGGARAERGDSGERVARSTVEDEIEGPSEATRVGELSDSGEFVCGVVERMGLGAFEVQEGDDDDLCIVQIRGGAAQRLSGGDGRAVDAIQLLANQAAMRGDEDAPRVVLEVEGDREQREDYLEDLAQRAARRALKIKRAVALDPMNSAERRILHVALRDADDVATMSTGSGRYRQVVVVPKGAPEYEEAIQSAEEAARRED